MRHVVIAAAALVALGAAALPDRVGAQSAYTPGPHNIELPADWQQRFVRYASVDRADQKTVRSLYVNPEAFASARPGQPLPYGTVLIMATARARLDAAGNPLLDQQGRFIAEPTLLALEVQRKEPGWGEGRPADQRNGEWDYAVFEPDGRRRERSTAVCFNCHLGTRAQQDFAFNFWDYVQARR